LSEEGYLLNPEDIRFAVRAISKGGEGSLRDLLTNHIPVSSKKRFIIPKTEVQKQYIDAIKIHDIVIGIGPAGTGKTYLAMAMAINAFLKKEVSRIVLARPAVEAGERLGFLPGDMYEKVNPYLRPLYDALFDMMDPDKVSKLMERGIIEIAPLAFMRGRTLNDSFIILDEAQNTTSEQMKMYLTRLGFSSKTVITGDTTQIDLPAGKTSGLVEVERILEGVEGIKFIYFSEKDVVRHKLVQEIVKAYERHEKRSADNPKTPE
jgi:phosphate starvation-inducible PhoH-like protein